MPAPQRQSTVALETDVPGRLDRLPWSPWHWRILIGLGTVWILDGLEVTTALIGVKAERRSLESLAAPLSQVPSGR